MFVGDETQMQVSAVAAARRRARITVTHRVRAGQLQGLPGVDGRDHHGGGDPLSARQGHALDPAADGPGSVGSGRIQEGVAAGGDRQGEVGKRAS